MKDQIHRKRHSLSGKLVLKLVASNKDECNAPNFLGGSSKVAKRPVKAVSYTSYQGPEPEKKKNESEPWCSHMKKCEEEKEEEEEGEGEE